MLRLAAAAVCSRRRAAAGVQGFMGPPAAPACGARGVETSACKRGGARGGAAPLGGLAARVRPPGGCMPLQARVVCSVRPASAIEPAGSRLAWLWRSMGWAAAAGSGRQRLEASA